MQRKDIIISKHIERYVKAIKRQLIEQYHFPEHPIRRGEPMGVKDNVYKVNVDGRIDYVKVSEGYIEFCNFDKPPS